MCAHLNRYGLEGSQDDLSALVQPLPMTADLERRLVDERDIYAKQEPPCYSPWRVFIFFFGWFLLTSEAMVKPMTSMQPSSCRCGSKSRWSPVFPHGMVPAQYLQERTTQSRAEQTFKRLSRLAGRSV